MQGIAALPARMAPADQGAPGISTEEAATLGRLLMKVSQEEVDQLRELSEDLKEFSEPELRDFLGGIDYLMNNSGNYKQAVSNLIQRGIVEPGDLPAQYIPTFFSILRQMIVSAMEQMKQPSFAKGGLVSMAEKVRKAGRHGDTMLAHITPREAQALKAMGGAGTINPKTGLPEYKSFFSKVGSFLKKAAPVILPVALSFIPGIGPAVGGALGVGATAGSAIVGAVGAGVGGLIAGQKPLQALGSALIGGLGSYALSSVAPDGISGLFGGGAGSGQEALSAANTMSGVTSPGQVGPVVPVNPASQAASAFGNFGGAGAQALKGVGDSIIGGTGFAGTPQVSGGLGNLFGGVTDFVGKYPLLSLGGAALAGSMFGGGMKEEGVQPVLTKPGVTGATLLAKKPGQYGFNIADFQAQAAAPPTVIPTTSPAFPQGYSGQLPRYYAKDGGHIAGPGTGTSDDVPAMLSDGEFVLTAKAVRGAGDGSRMKGAKRLYKLMNQLEKRA